MASHCRNCGKRLTGDSPRIEVRTADGVDAVFCSSGCFMRDQQNQMGGPPRALLDEFEARLSRRALAEGKI